MTLKRIADPAELPVSFEFARKHSNILKLVADDQREIIEAKIRAGTDRAEKIMGRAIIRQQWEKRLDAFPAEGGAIELAMPPLLSVDAVKYIDEAGVERTLSPECYEFDAQEQTGWLVPAYGFLWPATLEKINAVRVEFTAGYVAPGVVPDAIRNALVVYASFGYENRESVEDPPGFESMLDYYRVLRFA